MSTKSKKSNTSWIAGLFVVIFIIILIVIVWLVLRPKDVTPDNVPLVELPIFGNISVSKSGKLICNSGTEYVQKINEGSNIGNFNFQRENPTSNNFYLRNDLPYNSGLFMTYTQDVVQWVRERESSKLWNITGLGEGYQISTQGAINNLIVGSDNITDFVSLSKTNTTQFDIINTEQVIPSLKSFTKNEKSRILVFQNSGDAELSSGSLTLGYNSNDLKENPEWTPVTTFGNSYNKDGECVERFVNVKETNILAFVAILNGNSSSNYRLETKIGDKTYQMAMLICDPLEPGKSSILLMFDKNIGTDDIKTDGEFHKLFHIDKKSEITFDLLSSDEQYVVKAGKIGPASNTNEFNTLTISFP
jgi:hypothetical protein